MFMSSDVRNPACEQAFAYRYLTPHARMLYWRRVLEEYKALLPDMDAYVKKQVGAVPVYGRCTASGVSSAWAVGLPLYKQGEGVG